jgi:hypothetical protein
MVIRICRYISYAVRMSERGHRCRARAAPVLSSVGLTFYVAPRTQPTAVGGRQFVTALPSLQAMRSVGYPSEPVGAPAAGIKAARPEVRWS